MRIVFQLFHLARRLTGSKSGNVALTFGLMAIPMMAIIGGVVDYNRALKTKSQLASTLDAAVLAALKEYALDTSTDYKQVIRDFVTNNMEEKSYHGLDINFDIPDIGADGQLIARLNTEVPSAFLQLAGFDRFHVDIGSAAIGGGRDLEVVLVMDNTGSMSHDGKIEALRDSATSLVNILLPDDNSNADRVKLGLVPFAGYVNIGLGNRTMTGVEVPADFTHPVTNVEYKWLGCMGSRPGDLKIEDESYDTMVPGIMSDDDVPWENPLDPGRCNISPIVDMTNVKGPLTTGINDMGASGWTYIPGGLMWGWRMLSPQAPLTGGQPYDDKEVQKVIVLMTDGTNTRAAEKWTDSDDVKDNDNNPVNVRDSVSTHAGEVWGHSVINANGAQGIADGVTTQLCNKIKEKKIAIFTIAFAVEDGSSVETLMQNCAGEGGQFFDADSNEELEEAFNQIGLSLLNLCLSK